MDGLLRFIDRLLTFRQLLWLIPLVLTLHNIEEALTMPRWVMANLVPVQRAIPFGIDIQFSPTQLLASLSLATLVPFVVTILCMPGGEKSKRVYVLFLLQAIVLLNVFVPHLLWSIRTLQYNPGLVTALCVNLPFSIYLFRRGYRERYIGAGAFVPLFLLASFLYPLVAWLLHGAGELMAKNLPL
jgi:hypothetical protein